MKRIFPGDLLQISANNRFYYVILLDKISLFGGQPSFALYRTSDTPLSATEVLKEPRDGLMNGFYEIVDFIWAKRENRIERIATKLDMDKLNKGASFFKHTLHGGGVYAEVRTQKGKILDDFRP